MTEKYYCDIIDILEKLHGAKKSNIYDKFLSFLSIKEQIKYCSVNKNNCKYLPYCYNHLISTVYPHLKVYLKNTTHTNYCNMNVEDFKFYQFYFKQSEIYLLQQLIQLSRVNKHLNIFLKKEYIKHRS